MIHLQAINSLVGALVRNATGDKIGRIHQIYLAGHNDQPIWATIRLSPLGLTLSFIPLIQASQQPDGTVIIPVTRAQVKAAPRPSEDGHFSPEQEALLYHHYGLVHNPVSPPPATGSDDTKARLREYVASNGQPALGAP